MFTILVFTTLSFTTSSVSGLPITTTITDRHTIIDYMSVNELAHPKYLHRDSTDQTLDICNQHKNGDEEYRQDLNSCSKYYKCIMDVENNHKYTTMWFECDKDCWFDERKEQCRLIEDVYSVLDRKPTRELATTTTTTTKEKKISTSDPLFHHSILSSLHFSLSIFATWITITIVAFIFG
ncbi:hypothetical protein BDC45DRAFT_570783 [Circinella umbellata]|nr:hypothetical protein BDC45DRAFT_570783 [Circinella umbellata]